MVYQILSTETFLEKFSQLPKNQQHRIEKIKTQLRINPFAGKPLGYTWFREKKLNGFRLYFLIYEERVTVLMVDFSDKKQQQETINRIKLMLDQFKKEVMDKTIPKA